MNTNLSLQFSEKVLMCATSQSSEKYLYVKHHKPQVFNS